MTELETRIGNLPLEIYEYILDLSLAPDESSLLIGQDYRPPSALQLNRRTRSKAADYYYGQGSIFYCSNHGNCSKWLISLPEQHRKMLGKVRCEPVLSSPILSCYAAKRMRACILQQLYKHNVKIDMDVLYFRIDGGNGGSAGYWTNDF